MPAGMRILVAVSGGPDSTALLIALHESGREVVAAHYDHALQDGSSQVARQVADLCEGLGVELVSERRAEPMPRGSVQAGARRLRYEFFERARRHSGADVVAIAHTADDLVEGVVLHMLRGCGLAGFRGMPATRDRYVRPYLDVWRKDVAEFLRRRGVSAHADAANRDLRHARVRVRLQVLPALERDRPGILRRFHAAALAASALHDSVTRQAAAAMREGPPLAPALAALEEPVATEVLRRLYAQAGGREPGLSRSHLAAMLALARGGRGGRGVDLPGALRFRIVGPHMQVVACREASPPPRRLAVTSCGGCGDADAAHLRPGLDLRVAFRAPGLRMRAAGGRGTRKLQDMFVDARVPREDRDSWPLVFAGDRLAWVPGIAVEADFAAVPGEPAVHVAIEPTPVRFPPKVVRLETPESPRGESS
ncbi:MAG TPA: tRNA lysidine(34) synthetase TilS [Candidatus Dormibacteraeota bacterium]|nr:tRNA lysidine(34) synthetase TilS [Candidatus Dormibacteraeota bacterium]